MDCEIKFPCIANKDNISLVIDHLNIFKEALKAEEVKIQQHAD